MSVLATCKKDLALVAVTFVKIESNIVKPAYEKNITEKGRLTEKSN